MKKMNIVNWMLYVLLAVLLTTTCFGMCSTASAEETEPVFGAWLTIDGEEHFFYQVTNGTMCTLQEIGRADNTYPELQIKHTLKLGTWTKFTKDLGVKLDYDSAIVDFWYCPDYLSYALREGAKLYLGCNADSAWTCEIIEQDGDIFYGVISGNISRYTIDGYFVISTTADFSGTPAYEINGQITQIGLGNFPVSGFDPSEMASGGASVQNRCGVCNGSGRCHICGGKGRVYNDHYLVNTWEKCYICFGNGKCNGCGGRGYHR